MDLQITSGLWSSARTYRIQSVAAILSRGGTGMPHNYKPDGYNSVSPYLVVNGASATIDFLVRVFAAEELARYPTPDGKVMHAEVRIGDSVIMLADPPAGTPPVASYVHLYVPDVDATYQTALAAGAEPVQEPVKKDDPDKRGGFRDAGGTTWWVGTRVG